MRIHHTVVVGKSRRSGAQWLVAAAVLLLMSSVGFATPQDPYVDAVLDALERKGLLTAQEVHDIKLEARTAAATAGDDDAAVAAADTAASAPAARSEATTFPDFDVWGRLQPRYTYTGSKNGREGTNSFTFRRARMGLKGRMAQNISFRTQFEAANEEPDGLDNVDVLLDAWVRFEHFADSVGDIVIGQQFVPGYTRPPQTTASVERKFTEFLFPGSAGRARGLTLRRGMAGMPESSGPGLFDNRLQYSVGLFNGPDLETNNDNNDLMFAGLLSWRPFGDVIVDEYEYRDQPFRWHLNAAYATSRDRGSLDARVQRNLLGAASPVTLDNDWYTVFTDAHWHHWFAWASYSYFRSEGEDGLLAASDASLSSTLHSRAWTVGMSRTLALPWPDRYLGLAWQYQKVDNQHPSRTRLFDTLTGSPANGVLAGMNRGEAYHGIVTFLLNAKTRIINEYIHYAVDSGPAPDHGVLVTQLQIDF